MVGGQDGSMVGPSSAVDGQLAVFDGVTGKLLKEIGYAIDDLLLLEGRSGGQAIDGLQYEPSVVYGSDCTVAIRTGGVELATGQSATAPYPFWMQARQWSHSAWQLAINPLGGHVSIGKFGASVGLELPNSATYGDILAHQFATHGGPTLAGAGLSNCPLGSSQHYVTVGPHAWCDYITDGTDDQVQLQAALTAGGAGAVVVVAGLLNITAGSHPYTTAIGQSIIGTGWGIDDDGTSHTGLLLVGAGTGPVFEIKHRMTTIRDLSINGGHTSTGHAGCYGIKWATLYAWQTTIDHCYIFGTGDSGIYIDLEGSAMASIIKNCFIRKCNAADDWCGGIEITNTHDLKVDQCEIAQSVCSVIITGNSADNAISNSHFWPYSTTAYSICVYIDSTGGMNSINHCIFDNHAKSVLIESAAHDNLISNCVSFYFNRSSCKGMVINGDYNRIIGNNLPNESNLAVAIELGNDSAYNIITGNMVHGKAINDYGTGNEKAHNI